MPWLSTLFLCWSSKVLYPECRSLLNCLLMVITSRISSSYCKANLSKLPPPPPSGHLYIDFSVHSSTCLWKKTLSHPWYFNLSVTSFKSIRNLPYKMLKTKQNKTISRIWPRLTSSHCHHHSPSQPESHCSFGYCNTLLTGLLASNSSSLQSTFQYGSLSDQSY